MPIQGFLGIYGALGYRLLCGQVPVENTGWLAQGRPVDLYFRTGPRIQTQVA